MRLVDEDTMKLVVPEFRKLNAMAAPLATGTIVKADPENRLKEAVMNGFSDVMMNSLPSVRLRKNFPGAFVLHRFGIKILIQMTHW